MAWVDSRPVAQIKAARLEEMKKAREATIAAPFTWDGSLFDSNPLRLLQLRTSSKEGGFGSRNWRLADNTWRTISATQAAEVWAAFDAHTQAAYDTFATREAAILSATTAADVNNIAWAV